MASLGVMTCAILGHYKYGWDKYVQFTFLEANHTDGYKAHMGYQAYNFPTLIADALCRKDMLGCCNIFSSIEHLLPVSAFTQPHRRW